MKVSYRTHLYGGLSSEASPAVTGFGECRKCDVSKYFSRD